MQKTAFVILISSFMICLILPLQAQEVEITLVDNQTIKGTLEGFQSRTYRIRVDGKIRGIPEDDVISLTILGRSSRPISGLEEIEVAFGEGRTVDGMQAIHRLLDRSPQTDREARKLAWEKHQEGILRLIKEQNAKSLQEITLAALAVLTASEENLLLQDLQRELIRQRTETPDETFLLDLAETLAVLVHHMAALSPSAKATLPHVLETLATRALEWKNNGAAWKIYRAIVRIDSSRARTLRDLRLELAMKDALEKMKAMDLAGTVVATDEVLLLHPNHPRAFEIRETILFNKLQSDLNLTAARDERNRLIYDFLRIAQKKENRDWASSQLKTKTDPEPITELVFEQMRKYYPMRPGATWRYRIGEKNRENPNLAGYREIRIRKIEETENGRIVTGVIEEGVGNSGTTRPLRIQVRGDSIFRAQGGGAILQFPLQPGFSWEWGKNIGQRGSQKQIRKVTGDSRTVKTAHGTFNNCIEITFTTEYRLGGKTRRIESKHYYAPLVGLVKVAYPDKKFRNNNLELTSYRPR